MAVQLFKDGWFQIFDEYSLAAMLDAGWSLTPDGLPSTTVEVTSGMAVGDSYPTLMSANSAEWVLYDSKQSDDVEIIHNECGDRVEDCDCENPEVSAVSPATIGEIIEAIGCLDDDNTEHWTSQNKPMVVAIETLLGKPLVAGQRDEAWEQIKAV